jgi:hypothetical protein
MTLQRQGKKMNKKTTVPFNLTMPYWGILIIVRNQLRINNRCDDDIQLMKRADNCKNIVDLINLCAEYVDFSDMGGSDD